MMQRMKSKMMILIMKRVRVVGVIPIQHLLETQLGPIQTAIIRMMVVIHKIHKVHKAKILNIVEVRVELRLELLFVNVEEVTLDLVLVQFSRKVHIHNWTRGITPIELLEAHLVPLLLTHKHMYLRVNIITTIALEQLHYLLLVSTVHNLTLKNAL